MEVHILYQSIFPYWITGTNFTNSNFQIKAVLELGTDLSLSYFSTGKQMLQTSWTLTLRRLAMRALLQMLLKYRSLPWVFVWMHINSDTDLKKEHLKFTKAAENNG